MNIISTQYSLNLKMLEIFVTGCDLSCEGCHNKELSDYKLGDNWETWISKIANKIKDFDDIINLIVVTGGEPLLQDHKALIKMLAWLTSFKKPIVLFTRFELDEVPVHVKILVDYIKTGEYKSELTEENEYYGITLQTSNQRVWKKEGNEWK